MLFIRNSVCGDRVKLSTVPFSDGFYGNIWRETRISTGRCAITCAEYNIGITRTAIASFLRNIKYLCT